MTEAFKLQSSESYKLLATDFRLERAKILNKMKRALEKCNLGALREITNCVSILSTYLVDMRKVDIRIFPTPDSVSGERSDTDGLVSFSKRHKESRVA